MIHFTPINLNVFIDSVNTVSFVQTRKAETLLQYMPGAAARLHRQKSSAVMHELAASHHSQCLDD